MSTSGVLWKVMALLVSAAMFCGCHGGREGGSEDKLVVQAGDSALMLEDVLMQIPRGLSPEDSVAMFRTLVETWLRRQILTGVAERNLSNMDQIDKMVENYRADLLLTRYLALMDEGSDKNVSDRDITLYYRQHRDSMILEEPLVKGIFLKVPENNSRLSELREWMKDNSERAIDDLESSGLRGAFQYEYFKDRWHPWHEVAELIPYRFFDADAFLESTMDFETSYGGSVYIIHISEYVASGTPMPEDYARDQIREDMRQANILKHRRELISSIYKHEVEEGRLRKGIYDPLTGRISDVKETN